MTASNAHSGHGSGPLSGIWYILVTLGSFGVLSWLPFAHAAARLRSDAHAVRACAYAALATVGLILLSIAPMDASGNPVGEGSTEVTLGVLTLFGLMCVGTAQQIRMRREVYGLNGSRHVRRRSIPVDPAITRVIQARARRAKAREIVAKDPLMAHELRIGRPDLTRDYDDGGLVDLNSATAKAIAKVCELPAEVARAIVDIRTKTGGFVSVEDIFSLLDIPLAAWPVIRDRAVVVQLLW